MCEEALQQQLALLATHRRTLSHLVQQAAQYGGEAFTPAATANSLASTRAAIAHIKGWLREKGIEVEDEPSDAASPQLPSRVPLQSAHDTVGGDKVDGDKVGCDKVMGDQRNISTGGGDYAEGNIDERQGVFVNGGIIQGTIIGINRAPINIVEHDQIYDVTGLVCPYPGLYPFTYKEANIYAGRKHDVTKALELLTTPGNRRSVFFVTGASGSGKSSFVQAGLVPALEAYYNQRHLTSRGAEPFRPSKHPMAMLNDALQQLGGQDLSSLDGVKILIIDQFEEVFTQSESIERENLLNWLLRLPTFTQIQTHVIVTLRSDYLKEAFDIPDLWHLVKDGLELRAMGLDELIEAIQRPLQETYPSKKFDPTLVEKLAGDASKNASYLPLLQITLGELWKSKKLILGHYSDLANAITLRADKVVQYIDFDEPNPQIRRSLLEQEMIAEIFLSLVRVSLDDDIRRDVRVGYPRRFLVEALYRDAESIVDYSKLLDNLIQARLLSVDDTEDQQINIIHEALIARWKYLQERVQEKRQQLQMRERFRLRLLDWQLHPSDHYLLSGIDLAQANELDKLTDIVLKEPRARDFLDLSRAAEMRQLKIARSRQLAALSLAGDRLGLDIDLRLLLAFEARREIDSLEARFAIFSDLQRYARGKVQINATLHGHNEVVKTTAFSPNGKLLASCSDNTIILWDVSNLQSPIQIGLPLVEHTDYICSLAFSPDNQILVSGDSDGTVILWDISNPQSSILKGLWKAWSYDDPDERHITYSASPPITNIVFLSSGKAVAVGYQGGMFLGESDIVILDISNTQSPIKIDQIKDKHLRFEGFVVLPDGKTVAVCDDSGDISVFDISDPKNIKYHDVPSVELWFERWGESFRRTDKRLAISPDGKVLASAYYQNRIVLWDVSNPKVVKVLGQPLRDHSAPVLSVVFSPDGKMLASVSDDKSILLWDVSDPGVPAKISPPLATDIEKPLNIAFSPDSRTLAVTSQDVVVLWDISDIRLPFKLGASLVGHHKAVSDVAISPNGQLLASASHDNTIVLWDISNVQQPVRLGSTLAGHENKVLRVRFSPDNNSLASGDEDGFIILWDLSNLKAPTMLGPPLKAHRYVVTGIAFLSDGEILASSGVDHDLNFWDISDPGMPTPLSSVHHVYEVMDMASSPDGKQIACVSLNIGVTLWDVSNPGEPSRLFQAGFDKVNIQADETVAFSPNGKILAVDSHVETIDIGPAMVKDIRTIALVDISDSKSPTRLGKPIAMHQDTVNKVVFSPEGNILASASPDNTIILWDVSSPKNPIKLGLPLIGHTDAVLSVTFSPDGKTLASASSDGTVILWNFDIALWEAMATKIVGRNFTRDEWQQYLGDEPYRKTFSDLPEGK